MERHVDGEELLNGDSSVFPKLPQLSVRPHSQYQTKDISRALAALWI